MSRVSFALAGLSMLLASCAAPPPARYVSLDEARPTLPQSSPECLAAKLRSGEPFPAGDIPESALANRVSGWVAMRYDVIAGKAQNIAVVESRPAGVYDAAALRHAAKYREPTGATVRGCVMTIEVKF